MTIAVRKADHAKRIKMNVATSRRIVLVLSTLATIALAAQPAAAFDKSASIAHKSSLVASGDRPAARAMTRHSAQALRGAYAFFPAPQIGASAEAPREASGGVCDAGDNPRIC